ncbi:MAG TPA: GSU2403 family nucleotidyltransferase fold protein [Rhodocyclaceae bacterium]|nr:GSU2403 family nucleotidyltransferase fold protein [Rhodocyclaceae bacterium]
MPSYTELSLTAQTAYAQLLDAVLSAEHLRSVADLKGSFAAKTVRGHRYWYFQTTEPSGKLRQIYVGPDSEAVQTLIARREQPSPQAAISPLARSAIALGCSAVLPRHLRVIQRLAEYGFFKAGGVLIGTHAFLAFANMLGVQWNDGARTQDVDFAHAGKNVSLALPGNFTMSTEAAIQSLEMGLLPIAGLAGKAGAAYLNPREPDFRLDFLTTCHRAGATPFAHPQLGVTLQPLKFMEFSLENVQQAVLLAGDKAVLVNVPNPARYALHKLIIHGERAGSFAAKSGKDLLQAASLLARLKETRAWEVDEAWRDLLARGKGWVDRVKRGRTALLQRHPELDIAECLPL